ncbi:MAG: ABC transporter ATP-binding protein [Rhizobiaceae bacterium]|nr:ABC transporter ATP-binding protein [Rhizobiaceae bacterium]
MTAALTCTNISKALDGKPVLKSLSLEVRPSEVVSLLGASGSGKTTLLRTIAGLISPDAGLITLGEKVLWSTHATTPPERRRIGMVFQDYALWPHMTVEGNLTFALQSQRLTENEAKRRIDHALEVARLDHLRNRYPAALSGGQQQRVAIARCLASRPALMLFDEPLSNLDAALREDMRVEMMELVRSEGITVVYVTHDQAEAMAVTDRIAVMRDGMIAQYDTPQRIYEAPADAFVAGFIGGFSLLAGCVSDGHFKLESIETPPLRICCPLQGNGMLVVRPEDGRPSEEHPDSRLRGRVRSLAYQGRCWRLGLEIGAARVRLDWPVPVAVGSELEFSLPPDRCLVLPAQP